MNEVFLYPKPKDGKEIMFSYLRSRMPLKKYKIYKFRRKLNNLTRRRRKAHEKFMDTFKPRYDEIYFEGMKWLDSLKGLDNE